MSNKYWALIVKDKVVETTDLDPKGRFHEDFNWVPCNKDIKFGWHYTDNRFTPPVEEVYVPSVVSKLQFVLALEHFGVLGRFEDFLANDATKVSKLSWEYATHVERNSNFVSGVALGLGWTDSTTDGVFIKASKIKP